MIYPIIWTHSGRALFFERTWRKYFSILNALGRA